MLTMPLLNIWMTDLGSSLPNEATTPKSNPDSCCLRPRVSRIAISTLALSLATHPHPHLRTLVHSSQWPFSGASLILSWCCSAKTRNGSGFCLRHCSVGSAGHTT
jgi:hypothetical protein